MSRPSSRSSRRSTTSNSILSPLNDVVRRSRALSQTIASYGSRAVSGDRGRGRRNSINDEFKRRSISLDRATRFEDLMAQAGGVPKATKIRRWDGACRTTTNWDCLFKDPELWHSNGDCLVHLYGEYDTKRGPSLRLWLADIQTSNCRPLFQKAVCKPHQGKSRVSGKDVPDPQPLYDLFIPAPMASTTEETIRYHLTTRNFFAWMFEKPMVGVHLGDALCDLLARMNKWRPDPDENEDEFLNYVDEQGYTDFRDCPDHALALLHWAEVYKHGELWTDSFVHCVGMNERLVTSHELENISPTTQALITRANLEMAIRIDKASIALSDFCETDPILTERLRLSDSSLRHLDRFRTFLHSFYVQRHGYWPPHVMKAKHGKIRPLPKHTLLTMYADFRNLYAFMVNSEADPFVQPEISRSVVDVLTTFDQAMKFPPLPHLIPHLPATDFTNAELRRTKGSFTSLFRSRKPKNDTRRAAVASALMVAANTADIKVVSSAMIREYALFERQYTMDEKEQITASEARMARWVLIYALLQILISVTHAPDEVRDVEGVDYPLCAQTAPGPPWMSSRDPNRDTKRRRSQSAHSARRPLVESSTEEFDLQKLQSEASSQVKVRSSPYASAAPGPPPTLPPPSPITPRAVPPLESTPVRQESRLTHRPSRIPVRVSSRARIFVPKPSRIPVAISRPYEFMSDEQPDYLDFEDEDEDLIFSDEPEDPVSMSYLSDYDVDRMPLPLMPPKSSLRVSSRSSAAYSDPSQRTITGSPVTTILASSFPNTPSASVLSSQRGSLPIASQAAEIAIAESALQEEPAAESVPLPSDSDLNDYIQPPVEEDARDDDAQEEDVLDSLVSARMAPSKLSIRTTPAIVNPTVAAFRGRATTRSSVDQQSRHDSSASSMSGHSSGTEPHTVTSHITTPSIYSPSHYSERYVHRSRPSDAPLVQNEQVPPLPPTPSTAQSQFSHYTLAPEYQAGTATELLSDEPSDEQDEYEIVAEAASPISRALNGQRVAAPHPLFTASSASLRRAARSDALAANKGFISTPTLASFPSPPPPLPPNVPESTVDHSCSRRPSETPSQDQTFLTARSRRPSEMTTSDESELHEAGKSRRRRFFTAKDKPDNLSARRRGGKSLAAVFAAGMDKLGSAPASPAIPPTPATPMSFVSCESSSRSVSRAGSRADTSISKTTSHVRHRSSELAKQFREEIGWKRGPGWDGDVDILLSGDRTVA